MVVVANPEDYSFVKFQRSTQKRKKYDAVLYNKKARTYKTIPFGDRAYRHFEDKTGLGLYSHLDTHNNNRRRLYRLRHAGEDDNKFSSGWFALKYLW